MRVYTRITTKKETLERLGKCRRCFEFGEERLPLLVPQARDHLVLCLLPIGQCPCQCLAASFGQTHQLRAPVRPCITREKLLADAWLQVACERRAVHDQGLSQSPQTRV